MLSPKPMPVHAFVGKRGYISKEEENNHRQKLVLRAARDKRGEEIIKIQCNEISAVCKRLKIF